MVRKFKNMINVAEPLVKRVAQLGIYPSILSSSWHPSVMNFKIRFVGSLIIDQGQILGKGLHCKSSCKPSFKKIITHISIFCTYICT